MKTFLLFTILLILGLGAGACVKTNALCDEDGNCAQIVGELQVNDPRFEFPNEPIARGRDFWMRAGTAINARWNSYTIFAGAPGVTCNSMSPVNPPACEKCDLINLEPNLCPNYKRIKFGVDLLRVSTFAGFTRNSAENVIASILDVPGARQGVVTFYPEANASAEITTKVGGLGEIAQAKLFVLQNGMSQQVSYPLSKVVTSEDSPTVAFYSGVLRRSPLLEDNFSSSLTIEKVRVLQGTASTDPVTGKFAIKDACASGGCPKPSRIVFAMDYWPGRPVPSSYQYTCYADLSLEAPADGNFIQSRCPMFVDATPAYLHSFPQTEITWLVEFRANDGAVLPTGADLGIEFTIH